MATDAPSSEKAMAVTASRFMEVSGKRFDDPPMGRACAQSAEK
jgi:hypothetical protein